MVMNTSPYPAASVSSLPFVTPDQTRSETVETACPGSSRPSLRGKHSSRKTRTVNQRLFSALQDCDDLLARPDEDSSPAKYFRIGMYNCFHRHGPLATCWEYTRSGPRRPLRAVSGVSTFAFSGPPRGASRASHGA